MSNIVSAQNFLALWNLNPGATSSCSAVWITCMQFVCVLENITFCSLFIVWGHFAISIITVTSINHPFLFSSETWDAALNSLWLSVFCACNDFCISLSDSFKCFHTADVFATLVRASSWSCNAIVRYKLFSLFAYSAEHESMDPSCLVSTVQAGGGDVMVWGIFSWHTLGPLVPIDYRLNTTVNQSIVADHVHPYMTTVHPSSDATSSRIMHHVINL